MPDRETDPAFFLIIGVVRRSRIDRKNREIQRENQEPQPQLFFIITRNFIREFLGKGKRGGIGLATFSFWVRALNQGFEFGDRYDARLMSAGLVADEVIIRHHALRGISREIFQDEDDSFVRVLTGFGKNELDLRSVGVRKR